jgi:hypothetical protein
MDTYLNKRTQIFLWFIDSRSGLKLPNKAICSLSPEPVPNLFRDASVAKKQNKAKYPHFQAQIIGCLRNKPKLKLVLCPS